MASSLIFFICSLSHCLLNDTLSFLFITQPIVTFTLTNHTTTRSTSSFIDFPTSQFCVTILFSALT